ncbi:hypothetical protein EPN44_10140 [bacterium]|nr:MAG: hypothetical protein EPN44_10140 [bacterium]
MALWGRFSARLLVLCATAALLAACSGGGGRSTTPVAPTNALLGSASRTIAAARFLTAPAGAPNGTPIIYQANPPRRLALASEGPAAFPFTPSQCVTQFGVACYTPAEIRAGYDVPAALDGSGQTIVIVDAFGSPTIREDLHIFDLEFGLPDPTLNIIYPMGAPPVFPTKPDKQHSNQLGWAFETSLDVEWSHAVAPGATIDLVIAPSNFGNALNVAQAYVVDNHLGSVMSLSFGSAEGSIAGRGNNLQLLQADRVYQAAQAAGITVFASSGDNGATNGLGFANAGFPASDPLVTAVGGTNLFLGDTGAYQHENVWNDGDACAFGCTVGPFGATGGAPSVIFAAPAYQQALSHLVARTTSDVAYNASVYTSVLVYIGFFPPNSGQNGFYFFGGTSEGAPQWAAIAALANQSAGHAVGFINPKLYAIGANAGEYLSAFHDITAGDNKFDGPGFSAGSGYDIPTGLGTPNVANLISFLH